MTNWQRESVDNGPLDIFQLHDENDGYTKLPETL